MKRSNAAMEVRVFRYGLLPPLDWGEDCEAELARQTRLWDQLVEIERAHVEQVHAVAAADTAAGEAERRRRALAAQRLDLIEQRKTRRKAARSKISTPDLDAAITALSAPLQQATIAAKQSRQNAYAAARDTLRSLHQERYAAVKAAYHASGLWWGNYNAVIASYERARRACLKTGAELRFRRQGGSGCLTNQIQGGMSVAELRFGCRSQARIEEKPAWTTHKAAVSLTVTGFVRDGIRRNITWPMIMHRPIPDEMRIKEIVVHRQRVASRWKWHATFVCTREQQTKSPPNGPAVAINLGWRSTPQGIRVATAIRAAVDQPDYIVLPYERIPAAVDRCGEVAGARAYALNSMLSRLRQVDWRGAPAELAEMARPVLLAPRVSAGRLASLCRFWRERHGGWSPELQAELEAWRRTDKLRWETDVHRRLWIRDARTDFYRHEARRLIGTASVVIINKHDMAETARSFDLPPPARHQRVVAAPSELRHWLISYAERSGARLVVHTASNSHCAECGGNLNVKEPADLRWRCPSCGRWLDQDQNYARLMLAALTDTSTRELEAVGETGVVGAAPTQPRKRPVNGPIGLRPMRATPKVRAERIASGR
jgi:hypothetical protein